jgi:hypothetical protein
MGRVVYRASCLWGELTVGRVVVGPVLMGRVVVGPVLTGRVVRGASFDGAGELSGNRFCSSGKFKGTVA